VSSGET